MGSRERSASSGLTKLVLVLAVLVALVVAVPLVPGFVGDRIRDSLSAMNPFKDETIDNTGPSVLMSLTAISEFHAASGYYETVVDVETDSFLPSFIKGESVTYVGKGTVDATVDFGALDERQVTVSPDRTSVTVRLPAPTLDKPVLDLETSYVADSDEGLVSKFGGSDLERDAQLRAVEQMATAAASDDAALVDLAKSNTDAMLRGLFGALGYTDITVEFAESPL